MPRGVEVFLAPVPLEIRGDEDWRAASHHREHLLLQVDVHLGLALGDARERRPRLEPADLGGLDVGRHARAQAVGDRQRAAAAALQQLGQHLERW